MKTFYLSVAIFLIYLPLNAQDISLTFGEVGKEDFYFKYEEDPDVEAVVLFDKGHTSFIESADGGFEIKCVRTKRIKVFKRKEGDYLQISIPFYVDENGESEKISDIEAYVFNLEEHYNKSLFRNQRTKIRHKFSEIHARKERISDNWHRYKIYLGEHAVNYGTIIEYRYTLTKPLLSRLPSWKFQSRIPTIYSSYTVEMIPFYEYKDILHGISKFDNYTSELKTNEVRKYKGLEFNDRVHTYVLKNIPAYKEESYLTPIDDQVIKLDFLLEKIHQTDSTTIDVISTYPELIKKLSENDYFGGFLRGAKKFSKSILRRKLKLSKMDDFQKCEAIINYIKANYSWNGQNGIYTEQRPKDVIKTKKGNASELNLLLVALLQRANIDALPVIYTTNQQEIINKNYAFDHQFNNVLVNVNTKEQSFLADATSNLLPFNRISYDYKNEKGLIIQDGKENWVDLTNNINSECTKTFTIVPDAPNNLIRVKSNIKQTEKEAYLARNSFGNDVEKIKKYLLERNYEDVQDIEISNSDNLKTAYEIDFTATKKMNRYGDEILIKPFWDYPSLENEIHPSWINFPIEYVFKKTENFESIILRPKNFWMLNLPKNLSVENELIRLKYNAEYISPESKITGIKITASITFKKDIYHPADYARIKRDMKRVIQKMNEPIRLKKIR